MVRSEKPNSDAATWRNRQPRHRSGLPLALAILALIALNVLAALAVYAMR